MTVSCPRRLHRRIQAFSVAIPIQNLWICLCGAASSNALLAITLPPLPLLASLPACKSMRA